MCKSCEKGIHSLIFFLFTSIYQFKIILIFPMWRNEDPLPLFLFTVVYGIFHKDEKKYALFFRLNYMIHFLMCIFWISKLKKISQFSESERVSWPRKILGISGNGWDNLLQNLNKIYTVSNICPEQDVDTVYTIDSSQIHIPPNCLLRRATPYL